MKLYFKIILLFFTIFNCKSQIITDLKSDTIFVFFKAKKNQTLTINKRFNSRDKLLNSIHSTYTFIYSKKESITYSHIEDVENRGFKDAKKFDIKKIKKSYFRKNKDKVLNYNKIKNGNFKDYVNLLLYKKKTVYIIDKSEKKNGVYIAREVWVTSSLESE